MNKIQNEFLKSYIVYRHISPSGKVYVGITCRTFKERCGKNGYCYKDSKIFYNAIQKYGWNNIIHEVLLEDVSQSEAFYAEKYLIRWYKMHNISYNITDGGEGTQGFSHPMSEETKEKIRQANTGRKLTEEQKEYLRQIHTGKKASEETKEKLRQSHLGHSPSEETRKKMSESQKKRKPSEKQLEILKRGRETPKSEETKEKIRKTLQLTSSKNKAILQYTLDGEFIAEYISAAEAGRILGLDPSGIRKACRGQQKKCGNYIWKNKI